MTIAVRGLWRSSALGHNILTVFHYCSSSSTFISDTSFSTGDSLLESQCRHGKRYVHCKPEDVPSLRKKLGKKRRVDELCVERYPMYTRNMIQSWILQGKVFVDGKPAEKAGKQVAESANIELTAKPPKYVCRGGYKLEAAFEKFECDVKGKVVLDSGLSTGGFTDCLLQYGASTVYGVDVGYGQVAEKIRTDKRVCIMERTNLRLLTSLPELVDLATLDLSFISILLVMPAVSAVMKPDSSLITLIKPQFEALRCQVGGGGIVRNPEVHKEVREKVIHGVEEFGFDCKGWIESPIKGAEGNIEFLAYFNRIPLLK